MQVVSRPRVLNVLRLLGHQPVLRRRQVLSRARSQSGQSTSHPKLQLATSTSLASRHLVFQALVTPRTTHMSDALAVEEMKRVNRQARNKRYYEKKKR